MYLDDKYQDNRYLLPKDDISPDAKGKEWHRKHCEHIYSKYLHDEAGIAYSHRDKIAENRKYGKGMQDTKKYMNIFLGKQTEGDEERKGWMNVNWDIFSVAPKFKRVIEGIFEVIDFYISANAIDESASTMKDDMKWRLWALAKEKQFLEFFNKAAGINVDQSKFLPSSFEQLQLFTQMGGIKLPLEIGMEGGLDYTFYLSDWQDIKKRLVNDFEDINKAAIKDYVDTVTNTIRVKYVDPGNAIIILDKDDNVIMAGEIINYPIKDLRRDSGLTEDKLLNLAVDFNGKNGNPTVSWENDPDEYGTYGYDHLGIPVLDCEWASIDSYYKTRRKKANDVTATYDEPYRKDAKGNLVPPKVKKTAKRETKRVDIKVFRRGKWIIGTEEIFDYGLQFTIPRPSDTEANSSYHYVELEGKSMMETIKPNLDSMQLTWLDLQNEKVQSPGSGLAIEYTSLQNMTLGGKKMDPLDIIKVYVQTNRLVYKATTHAGMLISPGAGKPIQELRGGIGPKLDEIIKQMKLDMDFIRENTGINEIVAASNPNPEVGVGQSEMAIAATNNVLKPILKGLTRLKEKTALNCALRLQLHARVNGTYSGYYQPLGSTVMSVFKMSSTKTLHQIGIKLEAIPTAEEKRDIEIMLQNSVSGGRDGKPTITLSGYFAIKRLLFSGANIKYAQIIMADREAKMKAQELKLQRENMEIDKNNQQAVATGKTDNEIRVVGAKSDAKIKEDSNKAKEERETKKLEHDLDMLKLDKEIKFKEAMKPAESTAAVK